MPNLKVENEIANVQLGNFSTYLIQFLDATLEEKKCVLNLSSLNKAAGIKRRTRRKVLKVAKDGE